MTISCASKLAAASAALVPLLAWAQLYQCDGADGRPHFTDKPCGGDAKPLALPPPARSTYEMEVRARTGEKLETPLQYEYYDIRGLTLAELQKDINAKRRETRWGKAVGTTAPDWEVRYQVLSDGSGRCTLTKVSVVADTRVWIPRWPDEPQAEPRVRQIVNAFLQNVASHEQDHVRIHVESGQEMVRSLRAIAPASTCDEIRAEAQRRSDAIRQQSFERQLDYDRRTTPGFRY